MSTLRDNLENPWWAFTYTRYSKGEPANAHYGEYKTSPVNGPLVIDSNYSYSIEMERHSGVRNSYNIGRIPHPECARINACSDRTGDPYGCLKGKYH